MIRVTTFRGAKDNTPTSVPAMTWPAFCAWIAERAAAVYPAPRDESKAARDVAKARLPAIVCAPFSGPRGNDTVGAHTALACDVDDVPDLDAFLEVCSRWRCVVYESPSSTDEAPRLRVIAALPKPYPAHAAPEARAAFARELGLDPATSGVSKAAAPAQIMFIGGFRGTPQRRTWVFDGDIWTPPEPGTAPVSTVEDGDPSAPLYGADHIPDLSRITSEIEPEEPGGLRRGGRDISRALGGWLARRGYHPDAISEAVLRYVPSDQPDVRAEQARETAEQFYAGDARAAGFASLEERFGPDVMAELEDAVADPWVKMMSSNWPPPRPQKAAAGDSSEAMIGSADEALQALPEWVSDHVRACQEELRTPLALNIANALGVLASAVSGRLKVRIHSNYTAHTCLFVCSVAPPGELKSPSFKLAAAPIKAWVTERQDAEREDLQRRLNDRAAKVKLKEKLIKEHVAQWAEYAEAQQSDELTKVSIELMLPEPVPFDFLVEDVTPEALSDLLATHGRVACLSSDASKVFNVLAGQYSKGQADLGVWLEAYDGSMPKVHRIGRKAVEPRHTQTTLSAVLSIQPQVLERITGNAAMVGEGLVQRFCWVVCQSDGRRWVEGEIPEPVPTPIAETWDAGVRFLLDLPAAEVKLSAAAFGAYIAWRDELEGRLRGGDLAGEVCGWASKHLERTARIAAVLWACDGAEGDVSAEHMARAIAMGRWLVPHAVAALQGGDASSDEAAVLRWMGKVATKQGDPHGWVMRRDLVRHITPKRLRRNVDKLLVPLLKDLVGRCTLEATEDLAKLRVPK
jgi:replicative DNA helicase